MTNTTSPRPSPQHSGGRSGGQSGGRSGGRRGKAAASASRRQPNYRNLRHPFAPQSAFSQDEVGHIHATALRVLKDLGLKVLLPEAREILARGGARIDGEMVFIGEEMVAAALEAAPSSIPICAANPDGGHVFEQGAMMFKAGSGCPNVNDHIGGRRPGDYAAFEVAIKLCQHFDVIHLLSPCLEPQDIPFHLRHYAMTLSQLRYADKPMFIFARGHDQVQDCLEMIRLGLGLDHDQLANNVWTTTVINSNSPRLLDVPMAQGIIDFARAGQLAIITPFCLAGAMAPVTVAGALTLQHAEALAGITLAQMTRPGAPVSYGGFSSNVDMKSGSPAFGTPEHVKMQIGAGQLARHINLPWRSASGAASNTTDMQAAHETNMSLWGAMMGNATVTMHAAGWLEGGLSFGFEKFINDIEALQTLAELASKPSGQEAEIGFDAIAEVDPGGHFFAAAHTMERYDTAFYEPLVADLTNHGGWQAAGGVPSGDRATAIWQDIIANFTPPKDGEEKAARVEDFIARRTAEGGALPQD